MAFPDIANIASTLIATGAFYLSYRAFQQQKTFENENHYHEYKFNNYVEILKKMTDYLASVQKQAFTTYDDYKNNKITIEELEESVDKIEEEAERLQDNLESFKNFLPNEIIWKIQKVIDIIYDNDIGEEKTEDEYNQTIEHFKILADAMGDVEKAMIKDLGIDNIHKRLARRTRLNKSTLS